MDWATYEHAGRVLRWLEEASGGRYASGRRLDPFATSMRDFDDVSPDLRDIRDGRAPNKNDPAQRTTDLKNAGLVSDQRDALTELGRAVIEAWERYGVDNASMQDELCRHLLLVLEARRLGDGGYGEFFEYWDELRLSFDPLELIDNWDSLYALNYLDFPRSGFAPGNRVREEGVPASDIEFDLTDFARDAGGSQAAIEGGERIERALEGLVPRGRHRATFCMALEIMLSGERSAAAILDRFGIPNRPRTWTPFGEAHKETIYRILSDYGITGEEEESRVAVDEDEEAREAEREPVTKTETVEPTLPDDIDFANVLVEPPAPKAAVGRRAARTGRTARRKVDHVEKAKDDDVIGKLGEQFAMEYEHWRLREHPELRAKLHHVSKEDDSAGYDIASFDPDGTERYVEVKTTRGGLASRFFITSNELQKAEEVKERYVILRIANIVNDPKCCEVRFPFDGVLELTPATYNVVFRSVSPDDEDDEP